MKNSAKIINMPFANQIEFANKVTFIPFNRDGKVRSELMRNMNLYGFVQPVLMIKTALLDGTDRIYLVDGHNRVATANYLKMPFFGILLPNKFNSVTEIVDFVSSLNSSQKPWSNWEYIRAYSYIGMSDYQNLLVMKSKSPFSVTAIACMLHGVGRFSIAPIIRAGKFKISRLAETTRVLDFSAKLSKYKPLTNRMVLSLDSVMTLEIFDEEKFETAYATYCESITKLNLDTFEETFISWLK